MRRLFLRCPCRNIQLAGALCVLTLAGCRSEPGPPTGLPAFTFGASFDEVIKLEWAQVGPAYHQFDSIVVTAKRAANN